jgi:adenosylcobinamide-phosphate synthase
MIGYKNDRYIYFGRFAARLDDIANFIPARVSAVLMIITAFLLRMDFRRAADMFKRDRFNHASPNSAQTESVCAGALGIQLAGDAYYFGELYKKKTIGDRDRGIEYADIARANKLLYGTAVLTIVLCLAAMGLLHVQTGVPIWPN